MIITRKETIHTENMKRELAPVAARKEIEKEYKWRDAILSGKPQESGTLEGGGTFRPLDRIQDIGMLRKTRNDFKRNYERIAPIKLSPQEQNELWRKAKVLKDKVVVGMLSKSEIHPVSSRLINKNGVATTSVVADYDKLNSTRAVDRNYAWYKKNENDLRELKRILRLLEPDNPEIANVERWRKA